MLGPQVSGVEAEVDLPGKAAWRIFQRQDFLRKNLRPLVRGVDLTDNQDRAARREQFTIFLVVLVHAQHLHRAIQILECHHRVGLAVLL